MPCAICNKRRPKRFCPGVGGDICTICCGTEREETVSCPLDCKFLRDSRHHEKIADIDPETLPNRDVEITWEFVETQTPLLAFLATVLSQAAMEIPGVVDSDVRDALEALIRTYRTLQSGIYYETLPENAMARGIFRRVQNGLSEFRQYQQEKRGVYSVRDADVLKLLVFLQHLELSRNNGRRRGRVFISMIGELSQDSNQLAQRHLSSLVMG